MRFAFVCGMPARAALTARHQLTLTMVLPIQWCTAAFSRLSLMCLSHQAGAWPCPWPEHRSWGTTHHTRASHGCSCQVPAGLSDKFTFFVCAQFLVHTWLTCPAPRPPRPAGRARQLPARLRLHLDRLRALHAPSAAQPGVCACVSPLRQRGSAGRTRRCKLLRCVSPSALTVRTVHAYV